MNNKRFIAYIVLFALGVGLIIAGGMELVDNYWSGFGGGIAAVAAARFLMMLRYKNNEAYRQKVNVETKDERNKFIAMQARGWTMYVSVLLLAALCIVFQLASQPLLSRICGLAVCGMMVIYWISYLVLRRKY